MGRFGTSPPLAAPEILLSHQAGDDVGCTSSRKADDDAYRSSRIALRPRDPRDSRKRDCRRCQMQKPTTRKFHICFP